MSKILGYRYAKLHTGKNWYVDYYVNHPVTRERCRKKIMVDHIQGVGKRKKFASAIIREIDKKLETGWNPFFDDHVNDQLITIEHAAKEFLQFKSTELLQDNIRPRTYETYENQINYFIKHIQRDFLFQIKAEDAILFMDKLSSTRKKFGPVAYNDWVINMRIFFNWLQKRNYATFNPFKTVDRKREPKLKPQSISQDHLQKIREYCLQHDIYQWILCSWVYYCALRRTELTRLKISAIDFETQRIKILHTQSKNHFEQDIMIPDELFILLKQLNYHKLPKDYYLVTARQSYAKGPGPKKTHPNTIDRWFYLLREKLNIPANIKFYHFKHTMLTKIAAQDPVAAKNHGRFLRMEDINPYMAENAAQKKIIKNLKA